MFSQRVRVIAIEAQRVRCHIPEFRLRSSTGLPDDALDPTEDSEIEDEGKQIQDEDDASNEDEEEKTKEHEGQYQNDEEHNEVEEDEE
ncbi:hypothetical protein MKX03_015366 [Papaver bracteatum]|nr:hypothetical protein MKX03_015366 [Papaver bracteatum]